MKKLILLALVSSHAASILAQEDFFLRKKPKPAPIIIEEDDEDDDDEDAQVVLANIGNMLQSIGMLSTDATNPAIAGPAIASFGMSVVNIIVQMFKSIDTRGGNITDEQIIRWFKNLPEQTQVDLITILMLYAQTCNHA